MRRFLGALMLAALMLSQTGCARSVESWVVRTRNNQGDRALHAGNLNEAALAYRLALQVNSRDEHARTGLVSVQLNLADQNYRNGKLEDAITSLGIAAKIDPKNPEVSDLREQLDQARLKRAIVLSNYPTYKAAGQEIMRAFEQLKLSNQEILYSLKRFGYTYDTGDITRAIEQSYDLADAVTKNRARLVQFRQVVESGVGTEAGSDAAASGSSLLPLP